MYKINNNYYVKVGSNFVEVKLEYSDNDITLQPTKNKIRVSNDVRYEEFDFPSVKQQLLQEHNKHGYSKPKHEEEFESENLVEDTDETSVKRFSTRKYTR